MHETLVKYQENNFHYFKVILTFAYNFKIHRSWIRTNTLRAWVSLDFLYPILQQKLKTLN